MCSKVVDFGFNKTAVNHLADQPANNGEFVSCWEGLNKMTFKDPKITQKTLKDCWNPETNAKTLQKNWRTRIWDIFQIIFLED